METNKLFNLGTLTNIALIIINVAAYFFYRAERSALRDYDYFMEIPQGWVTAEHLVRFAVMGVGIAGLVISIICMVKNEGRLKGFGLPLAASIVTIIFGLIGMMLGFVIWILCGIGIKVLQKSYRECNVLEGNYGGSRGRDIYGGPANNPYGGDNYGNPAQNPYGGDNYGNSVQNPYGGNPYGDSNQNTYTDPFAGQYDNNDNNYSNFQ